MPLEIEFVGSKLTPPKSVPLRCRVCRGCDLTTLLLHDGVGVASVRQSAQQFAVQNILYDAVVHPGIPIRLRFSRSSELMCSNTLALQVASNRGTALLQPNKHVRHSVLDRKSPKDSISGIHMLPRCAEHGRFLSVGSKLQQISWKKSLVPRIAQNRRI